MTETAPPSHSGPAWPDLAGRLLRDPAGRAHILPIRVYFEDTDFSGLVYHASYVRWCERGRSDFLRLVGNDHRALFDGAPVASGQLKAQGNDPPVASGQPKAHEGAAFVVRRLNLEYLKPARIDDVLEVTTRVREMTAASLVLAQTVSRDGEALCEALVTVVLVSAKGRVLRLSAALKAGLGG